MEVKIAFTGLCLLILMSSASALEGGFLYHALGGAMWWPWACVTEKGAKGVCKCTQSFLHSEYVNNYDSPDECNPYNYYTYKSGYGQYTPTQEEINNFNRLFSCNEGNFCGASECPFGYGALFGYSGNPQICRNLDLDNSEPIDGYSWGLYLDITVPEDLKMVSSDGQVIDDQLCVGDKFVLTKGVSKGEWWEKGGNLDSPPIYWVDDVEKLTDRIIEYHKNTPRTEEEFNAEHIMTGFKEVPDGFIDPLTGVPVYNFMYLTGSMVCSLKENGVDPKGDLIRKINGYYEVTAPGEINLKDAYVVECMLYYYKSPSSGTIKMPMLIEVGPDARMDGDYGQTIMKGSNNQSWIDFIPYNSKEDFFKVGSIGINKTIKVIDPAKPRVELSVVGGNALNFGEPNTLRILVNNSGDIAVSIKSVYSKPSGKLVSCDLQTLPPGQQAECLLLATPIQGQGLSVEVSYDYKSCGRSQTGLVTKTLIDSKTFRPILKEQSYLMGVHGACDNSYYSCYSASEGSLFAGYKCYKTANGFYAPATERINLRFYLSDVPKNAEILGAKLYLKASEFGGKQTINIYSVNKIPEVVKCLPGGDICTKPYCGECKPLYDIAGTLASSAEMSSAGQYAFDVTNPVKEKLAGDGIVSLQIRGEEGLWESLGQSSCSIENDWDKRDISFDAGGRDGPYLEIAYKG